MTLHFHTAAALVLNADTGLAGCRVSLGQRPGAAELCGCAPGPGNTGGTCPVVGPQRSRQLRELVTFPRADSPARARRMPAVS